MKKIFVRGLFGSLLAAFAAVAHAEVVYNSIPSPLPPNVVSEGFQCCSTAELGDEVTLAPGAGHVATFATVVMSNWAKHSTYPLVSADGFVHPITFTLYGPSVGLLPGPVLGRVTQSFLIPWRPEHDVTCPGDAWKAADTNCYNGLATTIEFDLRNAGPGGTPVSLGNTVVYGVAFDTNTHGYHPIGLPGPYESLNVGLSTVAPSVGTNVALDVVFQNADNAFFYSDGGADGLNVFRKDTGWAPYTPAVKLEVNAVPRTQEDCFKSGWKSLVRGNGTSFNNQGDCVSYAVNGK